jgi:Ca2+-binding EF-hand superfamily protein
MNISAIGSQYGGISAAMSMQGANRMGGDGMDKSQFASNMIDGLDADGDGALSSGEVSGLGRLEEAFGDIDTDGDGLLTQAELEAHAPEGPPPMGPPPSMDASQLASSLIDELDTDSDGVLSTEEVSGKGLLEEEFGEIDTDGDGVLSQEELEASAPEGPPPMGGSGSQDDMNAMLLEALNQNHGQSAYSENSLFASLLGDSSGLLSALSVSA